MSVTFRGGSKSGTISMFRSRESPGRSFLKAITWRMTGTLDTFAIGFLVTGKVSIAGSIAGTELLTKVLLYYGHERVWALIH